MSPAQELRLHYKDVRERLMGLHGPEPKAMVVPPSGPEPGPVAVLKPWHAPYVFEIPPRRATVRRLITETAEEYHIPQEALVSGRIFGKWIPARQDLYYRCAVSTDLSFPRIARILGGRDHSTIIHGIQRHCQRCGLEWPRPRRPRWYKTGGRVAA